MRISCPSQQRLGTRDKPTGPREEVPIMDLFSQTHQQNLSLTPCTAIEQPIPLLTSLWYIKEVLIYHRD